MITIYSYDKHTWISGFFAPFIGALIGTLMYIMLIGAHLDDPEEDAKGDDNNNNGGDWRSTRFIPKAQVQNQSIYNEQAPPSSTYGVSNNNYPTPPPSNAYGSPSANYGVRGEWG